MRNYRHVLTLGTPLLPVQHQSLLAIPGVDVRKAAVLGSTYATPPPNTLGVPYDVARIVADRLIQWGVPFTHQSEWTGPRWLDPTRLVVAPEDIPEVRPEMAARLRPFQREGLEYAQRSMGSIAHWPCGAGKTPLGILFALSARGVDGKPAKTVVVTRATTKLQWVNQFDKWAQGVNAVALDGVCGWQVRQATPTQIENGSLPWRIVNADREGEPVRSWHATKEEAEGVVKGIRRTIDVDPDVRVIVVSWEILAERADALRAWGVQTFVADECHRGKSHQRFRAIPEADGTTSFERRENQSSAAMVLAQAAGRFLGLSATPAPDRTRDLWAQLDLCNPYGWGNFRTFAIYFCDGRDGAYGFDSTGDSNRAELQERLSWFMHHVEKSRSHQELPPIRRTITHLPASRLMQVRGSQKEWTLRCKQGPAAMMEYKLQLAAESKKPYLMEKVQEALEDGLHMVFLVGRVSAAASLGKSIGTLFRDQSDDSKAKVGAARLWVACGQGESEQSTTEKERLAIVKEYTAHKGPAVLVGTIDAWGEAIDGLQHATDHAVCAMLPWNYGKAIQAEGRFHRIDMPAGRNPVFEYIVAAGTIDETVEERILSKLDAVGEVLDDNDARALTASFMGTDDPEAMDSLMNGLAAKLLLSGVADLDDETFERLRFDYSPEAQRLAAAGGSGDDRADDNGVNPAMAEDLDGE